MAQAERKIAAARALEEKLKGEAEAAAAKANAEVMAVLACQDARVDELAEEKTLELKKSMAVAERSYKAAGNRHAQQLVKAENEHKAQVARLLASISSGQSELESSLRDSFEHQRQVLELEQKSEIEALQGKHAEELNERLATCTGIRGAARALLSPGKLAEFEKIHSVDKLGVQAEDVGSMAERGQRNVGKVAELLTQAVLEQVKQGKSDPKGAAEAIVRRRGSSAHSLVQVSKERIEAERPEVNPESYKKAMRCGNTKTAEQILSMADPELSEADTIRMYSDRTAFGVGDSVDVAMLRNSTARGKVVEIFELSDEVRVEGVGIVASARVWAKGSVRCTHYQIRAAKLHAQTKYPGAPVPKTSNSHHGVDANRAAFVASYLRDPSVVQVVEASIANSTKGVKYRLKMRRRALWRRLVDEMEGVNLKPISWGYFWLLTSERQYEQLTVDNCCCGTCRDKGFVNYAEFRDIVESLDKEYRCLLHGSGGLPGKGELLKRIDKEEEFRRALFQRHLESESSCGSHCRKLLLSTHCNLNFKSSCSHGCDKGSAPPQSMRELLRREPKSADYNNICMVCSDDDAPGNVLMCTHCNLVAHPRCVERSHWDLDPKGDWTCVRCVKDLDEVQHTSSCDECNEATFIVEDIKRLVDRLAAAEGAAAGASELPPEATPLQATSECKHATRAELLAARLEVAAEIQQEYHAHLIRDGNQECFKSLVLETMPIDSFFLLVDYWAKINVGKAGGTATCEGDSKGISAHGGMFVYRNPSKVERATISIEFPKIDWKAFGPASDEENGLEFLEEHLHVYADDAKQNRFHTKSVLEASVSNFLRARPWLNEGRRAFVQSDNASNYRDPTTEIDILVVGTRVFSEAGMGKDEGDADGAVNKRGLKRARDAGTGVESAGDCMGITDGLKIPGSTNAVLKLCRGNEDTGFEGRDAVSRSYHIWAIDEEHITYWEYLDVEASKESIRTTGRAVGFGPGLKMTITEFNKTQRTHKEKTTGASLLFGNGKETSDPNPKQRASTSEKMAAKKEMSMQAEKRAADARQKLEARKALEESSYVAEAVTCCDCERKFLSGGGLASHQANRFCANAKAAAEERQRLRNVGALLKKADTDAAIQRKNRIENLRVVKVTLSAPVEDSATIGIALDFDADRGVFVVSAVSGLASTSTQVGPGYVARSFDAGDGMQAITTKEDVAGGLEAGKSIVVELTRPPPSIPNHGSARKNIRKQAQFKMLETQREWLEEYVFKDNIELMRPADAWKAMRAKFSNVLRVDTSTPVWLEKEQIAKWLADKIKKRKDQHREAKKSEREKSVVTMDQDGLSDDDDSDDNDEDLDGDDGDAEAEEPEEMRSQGKCKTKTKKASKTKPPSLKKQKKGSAPTKSAEAKQAIEKAPPLKKQRKGPGPTKNRKAEKSKKIAPP